VLCVCSVVCVSCVVCCMRVVCVLCWLFPAKIPDSEARKRIFMVDSRGLITKVLFSATSQITLLCVCVCVFLPFWGEFFGGVAVYVWIISCGCGCVCVYV